MRVRRLPIALSLLLAGCVTTYQPLSGLHRPVAADYRLKNFEGTRLRLRCLPGDYLDAQDASRLCRQVGRMFEAQGATLLVESFRGARATPEEGAAVPSADLVVELRARLLHEENSTLLWMVSFATATLIPAISEYSFAQEVIVKDPRGFVLVRDTLQGRLVRYFGLGVLALNGVLDLLVRPASERIVGNQAEYAFSNDLYAQLTQLTFNAKLRREVLEGFPSSAPGSEGP